jgi:N-acyl-D-aspartate/D-glutamate deacylase
MPDLIIQNVQLLDGTGFPPRTADVAIENGRIAYIEARNAKRQLVRRSLGEVGTITNG